MKYPLKQQKRGWRLLWICLCCSLSLFAATDYTVETIPNVRLSNRLNHVSDPDDLMETGIEIAAQPPGKKLQALSLLSGGERTLTAIALLFAMLNIKPTPFCVLDEIEAALDEANTGMYAEFLKEYSQKTQFVIITHKKESMEVSDAMYGIAMQERGISSLVSVKLTGADAVEGA